MLLGSGDAGLEAGFRAAERTYRGKIGLEIGYDEALSHLIVGGSETKTQTVDTSKPPVLPAGGLHFEGRENIQVPAGSFNAQKFSYGQNGGTVNVWALKGIGILKVFDQRANGDTATIQLESYK